MSRRAPAVIEVLAVGPLALVQDLGRPGFAALGVGASGAADRAALRLGNRLLANPEGAAGIEVLAGAFALRADVHHVLALTGAPAHAEVDGTPVGHHAVLVLRPGQVLRLGVPTVGLRTCVTVRGGLDVPRVLGSCATDTLSGLGPPPLAVGDVLAVGPQPSVAPLVDVAPVPLPTAGTVALRARLGPRADWLADPARLFTQQWTASGRSDRIGVRLDGEPLAWAPGAGELPSEGVVRGSVQVPPGGGPVVFGADHPVTGGYPVAAVVLDADTDRLAQLRPGQGVRLVRAG